MSKGQVLSDNQMASYLRQAGFPEKVIPRMVAIGRAESGGDPTAHNPRYPDNSYGVWQINMLDDPDNDYMLGAERRAKYGLSSNEQLNDPLTNARAAFDVYKSQGLGAWSVHTSGAADQFMPGALKATADTQGQGVSAPEDKSTKKLTPEQQTAAQNLFGALQLFTNMIRGGGDDELEIPEPKEVSPAQMISDQEKDRQALLTDMLLESVKAESKEEQAKKEIERDLMSYADQARKAAGQRLIGAMESFGTPGSPI